MSRPLPSDADYHDALMQTFDRADELMTAASDGRLWPKPQPGSDLAAEDAMTDPFQTSHLVQNLINAAIEHLHAVAALVRRAGILHNAPPFTLNRAAVECGAAAYWMLEPDERTERLWRHNVAASQDTYDYETVSKIITVRTAAPMPDIAKRRATLKAVRSEHQLRGATALQTGEMIKDVDRAIASRDGKRNDHHAETYWRVASGFGHGRQWPTLNVLVREEVHALGPTTATVKMANTESRVLWGSALAYELIDRSLALMYERSGLSIPPKT